MNRTEEQFFALLRAGLWNTPIENSLFPGVVDWKYLLTMATMQTVTGVVFDGISGLPPELQPPSDIMRKLYRTIIRIEQSHELLNERLTEIIPLLQSEGITPILLKGQGVARNYPNPLRRQCGDIDLYIGEKEYQRACDLLTQWGFVVDNDTESHKHYHFDWKGAHIEFHRIAERHYHPIRNRKFQRWTQYHLLGNNSRKWNLNQVEIGLPPVNFDALYIFNHIFHHFITSGIGLRQLCDWTLYLYVFGNQIDRDELHKDLKTLGLLHAWQVFGNIAVHYLGLPEDEFPFYSDKYRMASQEIILQYILKNGNFGQFNSNEENRPSGYLPSKLFSLKIRSRRARSLFSLIPVETSYYYVDFLAFGVWKIIKDKFITTK